MANIGKQTVEETHAALEARPMYADWVAQAPVQVWVIDHDFSAYRALLVEPIPGCPGLCWQLVEASCVSLLGDGISVGGWRTGTTGWYPRGNCVLPTFPAY